MADPCCMTWYEELESIGNYIQEDDGYTVWRTWFWGTNIPVPNPLPRDLCGLVLSLFSGSCPSLGEYDNDIDSQWICPPDGAILNPPGATPGEYFLYSVDYHFSYARYYNWDGEPTPSPQDNLLGVSGYVLADYRATFGEPGNEWYKTWGYQRTFSKMGCFGYNSTPSVGCDCCCNCC